MPDEWENTGHEYDEIRDVCLKPRESITITPYMYHDFIVPKTGGAVLLGEISI